MTLIGVACVCLQQQEGTMDFLLGYALVLALSVWLTWGA